MSAIFRRIPGVGNPLQGTFDRSDQAFFRDEAVWEQLRKRSFRDCSPNVHKAGRCVPGRQAVRPGRRLIRWPLPSKEALEQIKPKENFTLHIFATDLDRETIDRARQGSILGASPADVFCQSPEAVFYQGRKRLPGQQGDKGDGYLRHAKRHHGPPPLPNWISSSAATF